MRRYEVMFIVKPDLDDSGLQEQMEKIKKTVSKYKGETEELNLWQKRELAYPINKIKEGIYLLGYFKLPEQAPQELSREWRLDGNILRFLILKKEK
jgi:small subunit ribosomal protein S6